MRFQFAASLALLCAVANAVPIAHDEIVSNIDKGLRLLSLAENEDPVWKTEDEKLDLMRQGVKFVRGAVETANHSNGKSSSTCHMCTNASKTSQKARG